MYDSVIRKNGTGVHVCVCVMSTLCPVSFSSTATLRLSFTTLAVVCHRPKTNHSQLKLLTFDELAIVGHTPA